MIFQSLSFLFTHLRHLRGCCNLRYMSSGIRRNATMLDSVEEEQLQTTLLDSLASQSATAIAANPLLVSTIEGLLSLQLLHSLKASTNTVSLPRGSSNRTSLLRLLARLSTFFNHHRILLFTATYQPTNRQQVKEILQGVFEARPELLDHILESGMDEFSQVFSETIKGKHPLGAESKEEDQVAWKRLRTTMAMQCGLARSTDVIASSFGQSSRVMMTLCTVYQEILAAHFPFQLAPNEMARSLQGGYEGLSRQDEEWLRAKLEILETAYVLLNTAFLAPLEESGEDALAEDERAGFVLELFELLLPLFAAASSSATLPRLEGHEHVSLITVGLLTDLERYYHLSERILKTCGNDDRGRELSRRFRDVARTSARDGLDLLRPAKISELSSNGASDFNVFNRISRSALTSSHFFLGPE